MNATKTTTTEPRQPFYLPHEQVDRADELCFRIRGILGCIRSASLSNGLLADEDIAGACMAVDGMVQELENVVSLRQPKKQAAQPTAGA